ncbi:MAG: MoaD/ThiS family protein [Candidatus Hodarchaeota archaeon]
MVIVIKLYGDLREKSPRLNGDNGAPSTLHIKTDEIKTVFDILNKFRINQDQISHIFVNSKYCGPGKEIKDGDRVGLFPKRMGLMFVEIPNANSIIITMKLFADLRNYGPPEATLSIPEGSTINSVIKRYRFPRGLEKLKVLVNGKQNYNRNYILKNRDTISIFPHNN